MWCCTPWFLGEWGHAPSWPGACRGAGVIWEITSKGTSSALKYMGILCFDISVCLPPSDTRGGSGSSADLWDDFAQPASPGPASRGRLKGQLSPALSTHRAGTGTASPPPQAPALLPHALLVLHWRQQMQKQQIPWACLELMQNWSKIKMPREVLEVCDFTES